MCNQIFYCTLWDTAQDGQVKPPEVVTSVVAEMLGFDMGVTPVTN
jgi:hypothetical protein